MSSATNGKVIYTSWMIFQEKWFTVVKIGWLNNRLCFNYARKKVRISDLCKTCFNKDQFFSLIHSQIPILYQSVTSQTTFMFIANRQKRQFCETSALSTRLFLQTFVLILVLTTSFCCFVLGVAGCHAEIWQAEISNWEISYSNFKNKEIII